MHVVSMIKRAVMWFVKWFSLVNQHWFAYMKRNWHIFLIGTYYLFWVEILAPLSISLLKKRGVEFWWPGAMVLCLLNVIEFIVIRSQ